MWKINIKSDIDCGFWRHFWGMDFIFKLQTINEKLKKKKSRGNLKILHTVWFQLSDILEKSKFQRQEKKIIGWQELWEREGWIGRAQRAFRTVKLLWYYNDECMWLCVLVTQLCRLWDPMDCGPPGSSIHGILQAKL